MIGAPDRRGERLTSITGLWDPKRLASRHAFWGATHAV